MYSTSIWTLQKSTELYGINTVTEINCTQVSYFTFLTLVYIHQHCWSCESWHWRPPWMVGVFMIFSIPLSHSFLTHLPRFHGGYFPVLTKLVNPLSSILASPSKFLFLLKASTFTKRGSWILYIFQAPYYIHKGLILNCCTVLFIFWLALQHVLAWLNRPSTGRLL